MKLADSRSCTDDDRAAVREGTVALLDVSSRALLAGVGSSVLVLDAAGRIGFANPAAATMLGCDARDLAGRASAGFFESSEPDTVPFHEFLRRPRDANAERAPGWRGTLRCQDGSRLPVRVKLSTVRGAARGVVITVATLEDLSDLLQMNEYVQLMAEYDGPTGLPRIESVLRGLEAAVASLHASGTPFAMLQIKADSLHRVRESLGHDAGELVLREIARRLDKKVTANDLLGRFTGEGFAILLYDCCSEEVAVRRGCALLEVFSEPFTIESYCVKITASIGISFGRGPKVTESSILSEAEVALRRSKSLGGNRVTAFLPEMMDWHAHSVQMESQMQLALDQGQFFLVYQPQVCMKTGRLIGVEALVRWNNPAGGLVMPGTFIPVAEQSGMIVQLGAWCLQTACREVLDLQNRLGYTLRLAVNVSPKQVHAKGFEEMVQASLATSGLAPECLEIEITEGLLMSHDDAVLSVIKRLQDIGVTAAIDDFGMGFANLGYITRFKFDRLKIDRSFVSGCLSDRSSQMIIASIVFLARSLGIGIVVEGIEMQNQAALLADLGCDVAQGYLYARPMTIDKIYESSKVVTLQVQTGALLAGSTPEGLPAQQTTAEPGKKNSFGFWKRRKSAAALNATVSIDSIERRLKPSASPAKAQVEGLRDTFDFMAPREPVSYPSRPKRLPGSARVVTRMVKERTGTFPGV